MNHGIVTEDVRGTFPADPFAFRSLDEPEPKWPRGVCPARHEWRFARAVALQERQFYEFIAGPYADAAKCYFVGTREGGGIVKIGYSSCITRRLQQLRGNSGPLRLELFATCRDGPAAESHYHRKFEAYRRGGEWFDLCPEIEAEIARLNEVVA